MYDERTRMIEQQLAANESARIRGIEQGIEQGIKQGSLFTYISLVKEGHLPKEIAAQALGISVEEFEKYL